MRSAKQSLFTALLVVTAIVSSGCGGAEGRKARYLARGQEYLAKENYDKAIIEIRNALQIDPNLAEAYYLLGEVETKRGNLSQAYGAFARAAELDPENLKAQIALTRLYLVGNDVAKAAETAEFILARRPGDPEARLVKASILSRQGNDQAALKQASDILSANPGQAEAAAFVAVICVKLGQTQRAIDVLQRAVEVDPKKNVALRQKLAEIYATENQIDKAEAQLREMIAAEPDNLRHRVLLSQFLERTNQGDKAEAALREVVTADPDDPQRYLLLAEFVARHKGPVQGEKELVTSIKLLSDEMSLRFALAGLYESTRQTDKAANTYRAIIKESGKKPDGLKARNQLAQMLFAQGRTEDVEPLIDEVLAKNPRDNDALILQGQLRMSKQDAAGAINSYRSVLKDQPENSEVYGLLAQAYLGNKEPVLAEETFRKAVETNRKNVRAHLRLAEMIANRKDPAGALEELDRALNELPDNLLLLQAKGQIYIAIDNSKGADVTINRIETVYGKEPAGLVIAASLRIMQQRTNLALRDLEQAHRLSPTAPEPITGIVKILLEQKQQEKAIRRLQEAIKVTPNNWVASNLLGELYLTGKEYGEAEKAFKRANEIQPTWNVPYRNLATLRAIQGDLAGAKYMLDQGLKAVPDDSELLFELASLCERTRDYATAVNAYERILQHTPNNVVAAKNLARLQAEDRIDSGNLKRAPSPQVDGRIQRR